MWSPYRSCSYGFLDVFFEQGLSKVLLNRPELHNAFNPQLIQELKACFQELAQDSKVRAVILTGAGKSFCAGADLHWMKEMNRFTEEENREDSRQMAHLFQQLQNFPKPLIGQINGAALGGGVGLVSVCDLVLAQEKATFGFSEVQLGLIPAVISPYILKKIGFSQARRLMLTGERFSAQKAQEIGLVHEVCPPEKLELQTLHLAKRFLENGPQALAQAKFLLNTLSSSGKEEDFIQEFTSRLIAELRISPEGQEGIQALFDKRKPSFFQPWKDPETP
jgi:methylglutaconyl-CoA hydratase